MTEKIGRLIGVGVGPGDPDLVTIKAIKALHAADVVAYPVLKNQTSMARAIVAPHIAQMPQSAVPLEYAFDVPIGPKNAPARIAAYDAAAAQMAVWLQAGQTVVVLCEGDPFFYGSFMYIYGRLSDQYAAEVIPGVSSLMACAASLRQPLAAWDDFFAVLPATLPDDKLETALRQCDCAAIIKVGRHSQRVASILRKLDLFDQAGYVAHATLPDQKVQRLADVALDSIPYFSMVLVHKTGAI